MEMGCFTHKGSARYCHVDVGLTVTRQPAGLRKAIDLCCVCVLQCCSQGWEGAIAARGDCHLNRERKRQTTAL